MKINNEERFNLAPTVTMPRSTFLMHQNIRTTFNAGKLIPFYVDSDIMPGDTFKIKGTFVVRQSTPIYPTMDNTFLDVFFFFQPHRLCWDHWKEFWGQNDTGAWTQQTTYTIPQILYGKSGSDPVLAKGYALQYMGVPIQNTATADGIKINALPWRAYAEVWNNYFRDENMTPPLYVYKGDSDTRLNISNTYTWGNYQTGSFIPSDCAPVYKYKDYFNACLPEPQKGDPITLPIGQSAPVTVFGTGYALGLQGLNEDNSGNTVHTGLIAQESDGLGSKTSVYGALIGTAATGDQDIKLDTAMGVTTDATKSGLAGIADLSNAVAATINAQRMAFAAQRILEVKARAGSRYVEICNAIFGVNDPMSARQQRPEFLGHRRIPITMNQVAQTSSTDSTSPQGNVSAFSLTVDSSDLVNKSFVEHGTLLGVLCVRQEHSYDTGLNKMWSRKTVLDFYQPQMAFLGEQAVLNKEIYLSGTSTDNQVFGYTERWAEYRYKPNINTGAFSTKYAQSLASWHYGDAYNSLPVLSDDWRRETKDFIDRTLAVQSSVEDQYLMDCRLDMVATRPLPCYSVPGLLDHF